MTKNQKVIKMPEKRLNKNSEAYKMLKERLRKTSLNRKAELLKDRQQTPMVLIGLLQ